LNAGSCRSMALLSCEFRGIRKIIASAGRVAVPPLNSEAVLSRQFNSEAVRSVPDAETDCVSDTGRRRHWTRENSSQRTSRSSPAHPGGHLQSLSHRSTAKVAASKILVSLPAATGNQRPAQTDCRPAMQRQAWAEYWKSPEKHRQSVHSSGKGDLQDSAAVRQSCRARQR